MDEAVADHCASEFGFFETEHSWDMTCIKSPAGKRGSVGDGSRGVTGSNSLLVSSL
jgi:hypothetical protein